MLDKKVMLPHLWIMIQSNKLIWNIYHCLLDASGRNNTIWLVMCKSSFGKWLNILKLVMLVKMHKYIKIHSERYSLWKGTLLFSFAFCVCDQHWPQSTWRGAVSFALEVTVHHQMKSGQGLKAGTWRTKAEVIEKCCLLACSLLSCLATFLTQLKPTRLGMALPKIGTLLHQLATKRLYHRHDHRPVRSCSSSNNVSASQVTLGCVSYLKRIVTIIFLKVTRQACLDYFNYPWLMMSWTLKENL